MVLVKSDLHIHTSEDKEDTFIKHSAKDLIDFASKQGINVLAITLHEYILPIKNLKTYAKKKNIFLISGVEAKIEGKHVLIYNITSKEFEKIKKFDDLRKLKKKNKNIFVIAPHPFMPKNFLTKICLQDKYFENKDLFDAIEHQMFHFSMFNPNKRTEKISKLDHKPLIANSDVHFLNFFGKNYSTIDVEGKINEKNVFDAIKQNRVTIHNKTNFFTFTKMIIYNIYGELVKLTFRKTK